MSTKDHNITDIWSTTDQDWDDSAPPQEADKPKEDSNDEVSEA